MSRTQTTAQRLFGGDSTQIWATMPQLIHFEKADAKFVLKIVEYDIGSREDYCLLDIRANIETDLLQTGVKTFKQNSITREYLLLLRADKRELLRRTESALSRDATVFNLVKSLYLLI